MSAPGELDTSLVTPEGFVIRLPLASLGERFTALCVDLSIIVGLSLAMLLLLGAGLGAALLIGLFVVRYGYFVFFELRWQGATPGKRLLGIRVVSADGAGLGVESVIARNVLRDLEMFLPLTALLAPKALVGESPPWLWIPALLWVGLFALMPFLRSNRQRAGDLVGGTLVVRVPRTALLEDQAAPVSQRTRRAPRFTREQLAIYGEHELETLANLLRQADSGRADYHDLSVVARTIAHKIGYTRSDALKEPLAFLRAFYRAQRDALERRLLLGKRKASKYDRD